MAHTCFGEYCAITNSWDCPNRSDRESADKRTPEQIENARVPIRLHLNLHAKQCNSLFIEAMQESKLIKLFTEE